MPIWLIALVGVLYGGAALASGFREGNWAMAYLLACYAVASHALILVQKGQG